MQKLILFLLLVLIVVGVEALELEEGRVKLILHEGLGRFSLYSQSDDAYVPLFVDQDPRTTKAVLVVDNKIVTLGESAEFKEAVEKTANGARFIWTSKKLIVTQAFTFISSQPGLAANGVRIDFSFSNQSGRDLSVGMRFCIDTYLGEDKFLHFTTDKQTEIARETTITSEQMIRYWASPSGDTEAALECHTSGNDVTIPDRIVFANWKRLNDAPWAYETAGTRNFNSLPYSINDSAVCQYYEPITLKQQGTRQIVSMMGDFGNRTDFGKKTEIDKQGDRGTEAAVAAEPKSTEITTIASTQIGQKEMSALSAEIDSINLFLNDIDTQLSGRTTTEDIQALERTLADLKRQAAKYTGR